MTVEEAQRAFGEPLTQAFYAREARTVAAELLNTVLVRVLPEGVVAGRITETEAYTQDDPASHSFGGKRVRNAPMFGPPGRAYIYFTYGAHHCMNVVTGEEGTGDAVLIRALEPLIGLELLRVRRGLTGEAVPPDKAGSLRDGETTETASPTAMERKRIRFGQALCGGPGKLCQAFGLDRALNGLDLTLGEQLWIAAPVEVSDLAEVVATPRIGISQAQDFLWRFTLRGDPYTSRGLTK